jgi:hypothetical protein
MPAAAWALSLGLTLLVLALGVPARSQAPAKPAESIVDAALNARQRKSNSATPPVIFTNDDIAAQSPPSSAPAVPPESSPKQASVATPQQAKAPTPPTPATTDCNNPNEERLEMELQSAQDELDQLRRELSYNPQAISGGDVDLKNFKWISTAAAIATTGPGANQRSHSRGEDCVPERSLAHCLRAS